MGLFKYSKKKFKQLTASYEQKIQVVIAENLRKHNSLSLEKAEIQQRYDIDKKKAENWKQQARQITNSYNQVQQEKQQMTNSYNQLQQENQQMSNSYNQLQQEKQQITDSYNQVQREKQQMTNNYNQVQREKQQMTDSYNQLQQEKQQMADSYNQVQREKQQMSNNYNQVQREKQQMTNSYNQLQQEKQQMTKSYNQVQQEKQQMTNSYNQVQREKQQMTSSYNQLKQEKQQMTDSYNKVQREKQKYLSEISQLDSKIEQLNKNQNQEIEKIKAEFLKEMINTEENLKKGFEIERKNMLNELAEQKMEKNELMNKLNQLDQHFLKQQAENEENIKNLEGLNKNLQEKLLENLATINYHNHFPKSEPLTIHQQKYPNSLYIQFLGARGAGKSSLINKLRKILKMQDYEKAKTSHIETTLFTTFYEVSSAFSVEMRQTILEHIFLVDQPGVGGLNINRAQYLARFGPGHFDLTFVLGTTGLNEDEQYMLKHLDVYNRDLVFVRSKVDCDLIGSDSDSEEDPDERFKNLKEQNEINVSKIAESQKVRSFYIGRKLSEKFVDYKKIIRLIKQKINSDEYALDDSIESCLEKTVLTDIVMDQSNTSKGTFVSENISQSSESSSEPSNEPTKMNQQEKLNSFQNKATTLAEEQLMKFRRSKPFINRSGF